MNIHDVVEPRDIFFQQHWEEYYFFRKKNHSLGNNGTFHTPNIHTLPLKWGRALKSVKTITINLPQEPTDHKSSILNKYQMELFYRKF